MISKNWKRTQLLTVLTEKISSPLKTSFKIFYCVIQTLTIAFPKFLPLIISIKAFGVFSNPSVIVS